MVRFNIIGHGFLDMADPTGVAFKTENYQFRFANVSLGRTVEFAVPGTQRNREMLGYGEDQSETGEMLRRNYPCQLVYDGGQKMGTIAVTGFESDNFRCVFTVGNAEWIDALQNKKLSECIVTDDKGVVWDAAAPTYDANTADPSQLALIVRYDNGGFTAYNWHLVPSLSVQAYLEDIFANLGIPVSTHLFQIKPVVGQPEALPFIQDALPGQARLEGFQYQKLEQCRIIVHRNAPFFIVIFHIQRIFQIAPAASFLVHVHPPTAP